MTSLSIHTPAKINLYLSVLGKRTDGFHELETLMTGVGVYDEITLVPDTAISLHTSRPFGPPEKDLCYRAARLFSDTHPERPSVAIKLKKHIPDGAGLGGGSSDAAAVLAGMERLFGSPSCSIDELAARLGSDINFFLQGGTAWCYGRGEHVEQIGNAPSFWSVIIFPHVHTPTPAVFKQLGLTPSGIRDRLDQNNRSQFLAKPKFSNDLERAACEYNPELESCRFFLQDLIQFKKPVLSGSGSSFFYICSTQKEGAEIESLIRAHREWPIFLAETNKDMKFHILD